MIPRALLSNKDLLPLFLLPLLASWATSQSRVLDDFEDVSGWRPVMSEGARLSVAQGVGKNGGCLLMEFDLSAVFGYVIAQKDFALDLPGSYQFSFDLKAETPVNNFEFKLIDDRENVFWIKKLNVTYPRDWTRQRITKRQITFAWGPAKGGECRTVRKIEFVVSCGNGGKGKVFIDNFRFEPIDDMAARTARAAVEASSAAEGGTPRIDSAGNTMSSWRSRAGGEQWIAIDFGRLKDVGGLVIDWDSSAYATAYDVLASDDGTEWTPLYAVRNGNGGRDYVPTPESQGRRLKLLLHAANSGVGYGIRSLTIRDPQFSASGNDLFRAVAADAPPGFFPMYFQNRQSYWTVVGVNGDDREALINEQGQIEVDKNRFSLEPFLFVDGRLVTWNDVTRTQELLDGYLPVPAVTWNYRDLWTLRVEACAGGVPGNSLLGVRYTVTSRSTSGHARLFIALRPFQVNPPWQQLNLEGGVSRIDSMIAEGGMIRVNGITVVPMSKPDAFGATEFDRGDVTDYLARGIVPPESSVRDHGGYASGALAYDLNISTGQSADIYVAVPFHGWRGSPTPAMGPGAGVYYDLMLSRTVGEWQSLLNRTSILLPPAAGNIANTLRSNLAYIFINRDGPGIQPGSRSYERSWIRDGSLTCSALLRTGNAGAVREFIDWYARGQFPSGKIPCVIDSRGPDAVPEHDSHGEFIFAVYQYFLFSKDTTWLRGKFGSVIKTVDYIRSLRAERKIPQYRNGSPEERALYGLVPASISHEGYSDVPRHSYWDDFFVLRGLKDATAIAAALRDETRRKDFAAERDDFRRDLYASMRQAMRNTAIDYIPGCAELGDFDATSTTIGIIPGGELGNIPEPQLHTTFDRYFRFFSDRASKRAFMNYTPYETRVIGSFVALGERERAAAAVAFFMHDRRPAAWNQWAEVVWGDPSAPKFIGDMPHTWVGSDFIRSVLTMLAYERERDNAVVLAAGIPESWLRDSAGVSVAGLLTPAGTVNYRIRSEGDRTIVDVAPGLDPRAASIIVAAPRAARPRAVTLNGKKMKLPPSGELRLRSLPAHIEYSYR